MRSGFLAFFLRNSCFFSHIAEYDGYMETVEETTETVVPGNVPIHKTVNVVGTPHEPAVVERVVTPIPEVVTPVAQTTRTTTRPTIVTEHPQHVYEAKKTIFRAYQVIWYVLALIEILLAFRMTFRAIGANAYSGFVMLIYGITGLLTAPFRNIIPSYGSGTSVFEWSTIIAAAVYLLIAWGIVYLFQLVKPVTPGEVADGVDNP